jgi:hypothetical protein
VTLSKVTLSKITPLSAKDGPSVLAPTIRYYRLCAGNIAAYQEAKAAMTSGNRGGDAGAKKFRDELTDRHAQWKSAQARANPDSLPISATIRAADRMVFY